MLRTFYLPFAVVFSLSISSILHASIVQTSGITSFNPTSTCATSNNVITVLGSGFSDVVSVKIGVKPVSYTLVNDSTLQILNISGATSDHIIIETSTDSFTSPNELNIIELNSVLSSDASGVVCENTSITYAATGGSFYEFFVGGSSYGAVSPNNSITITPNAGQNIYAVAYDSSMSCSTISNVITAQIEPISSPVLLSSSANINVCNDDSLSANIIYQLTNGASDAVITGLPPGISAEINANNVIISGTPNVNASQDYNYVITPAGVPCVSSAFGTISVTINGSLNKTNSSGSTSQTLCEGSAIIPIEYVVGGGATSATVMGLPSGVAFDFDGTAGILSIEGTPSDNITAEQVYSFVVSTAGSNCVEQTSRGSITVEPLAQLSLMPSSGALDQILCEGDAITPILIALEGGTDIANISGLPNGINYALDAATQIVTISGGPTDPIDSFSEFSYVVSSISSSCTETTLQGIIKVNGDSTLTHVLSSGDTSQTLCEGSAIVPIEYVVGGGATSAAVTGLPNGVTFNFDTAAGILSIEGTPSDNITTEQLFSFAVATSGSNCVEQISRGSITVEPLAQLSLLPSSGALDQTLCEGEAITPILIALEGAADITNIAGLPNGLSHSFNSVTKILSVTGTPLANISSSVESLISFASSTTCNTSYLTGSLKINPESSVALISHLQTQNQLVCGVTPIEKIEYRLSDGATGVTVTGLPPGVDWSLSNTIIEIVGVPDNVVYETEFEYAIVAEGNGCSGLTTSSIIITPNTMDVPVAEEQQFFCVYDYPTINDIEVYANNLKWYSASGLEELSPDTLLVDGEVYYAHNEVIISEASAIDRYACRSFPTAITVFINDASAPQILEPSNSFCNDGLYTLKNIKVNVEQVVWYNSLISDVPLSLDTPLESMTYYAAAIDPETGCESTLRTDFEIEVNPCTATVYNALSVNGDGLNETLIIENVEYFPENELIVYNRNGRVVFKTSNYGVNGNFFKGYSNSNSSLGNAKLLPMGTYFYKFSFIRPLDGKLITTNGFINLVTN